MLNLRNEELFNDVVSRAIENAITRAKTTAIGGRWMAAIGKAATEIAERNPYLAWNGHELIAASRTGTEAYSANGTCQCNAYKFGRPCWHRAARQLWVRYLEAEAQAEADREPMISTAMCDICGNEETGTMAQLERCGWSFGRGQEFCPEHD